MIVILVFFALFISHLNASQEITSSKPAKPLLELAAEALLKKWSKLPDYELPSDDEISKLTNDHKNLLQQKLLLDIYQWFAFKALYDTGKKNEDDYDYVYFSESYTDAELELLPGETVTTADVSTDITRALIQVNQPMGTPSSGAALFYIFDESRNRYQSLLRFSGVYESDMSKDGSVIALCKANNENPLLVEVQFQLLQAGTNALYKTGPIKIKELVAGQKIVQVTLNNTGSHCIIKIENSVLKTKDILVWKLENDKIQEIAAFENYATYSFNESFQMFLITQDNKLILKKINDDTNQIDTIWEKPTASLIPFALTTNEEGQENREPFFGAALNITGTLVVSITKEVVGNNRYTYHIHFKNVSNGENLLGYKEITATAAGEASAVSIRFITPQFLLFAPNQQVNALFTDGVGPFQFLHSHAQVVMDSTNGLLCLTSANPARYHDNFICNYKHIPGGDNSIFPGIPYNRGYPEYLNKVVFFGGFPRFFAFGPDMHAASLVGQRNNVVIRRYDLAGKWTKHLQALKNINLKEALLLQKLIQTEDSYDVKMIFLKHAKLIAALPKEIHELTTYFFSSALEEGSKILKTKTRHKELVSFFQKKQKALHKKAYQGSFVPAKADLRLQPEEPEDINLVKQLKKPTTTTPKTEDRSAQPNTTPTAQNKTFLSLIYDAWSWIKTKVSSWWS